MMPPRRIARRVARATAPLTVCALGLLAVGFDHALYRHEVVTCGPRDSNAVALTFDDGPDSTHTPAILDILAERGARATFYVIGEHVERHPDIVRRIIDEGHEIAQHTYSHPRVNALSGDDLAEEFERASLTLEEHGVRPAWYRPPRKELCGEQKRLAAAYGMRVGLWTRALERSRFSSAEEMAATLLAETDPGDVLLAHDGRLNRSMTVEALPVVLDGLAARGIAVVTMSELCPE